MKKKVLGLLMAAVLCLCLLPVGAAVDGDVTVKYDGVDEASGNIKRSGGGSRNGTVLTASDTDVTLSSGQFYIVQDNVTISGDLTVDGSQAGGLILCANATLTVNGALIHTGGTKFSIYGQTQPNDSQSTGKLIINNNSAGAAIRAAEGAYNPQLCISSGKLTINGNGKKLVDGVQLYSEYKIHKGTLDNVAVKPSV